MAGTWIKMLTTLHDSHKVRRLSRLIQCDRFAVVGRLHRVWSWADEHTIDGRFTGDIKDIDDIAEFDGFAQAMTEIGWLTKNGDEIVFVDFNEHNGETAKKRAQGAQRAARRRGNAPVAQKSRTERYSSVTKCAPREEKRREEKIEENSTSSLVSDGETPPRPTTTKSAEKRAAPVTWDGRDGFQVCAFRRSVWAQSYPRVDIQHELAKAHAWYTDNPGKRKRNHGSFLGNWLNRAQENAKQDARAGPSGSRANDRHAIVPDDPDDNPLAKLRAANERQEKRA